jgi:hypothetical protein
MTALLTTVAIYQCSETNVMHFLFNLLRIKSLYMFRALLPHPQETLHKRQLVYCVRTMSVGCTRIETRFNPAPGLVVQTTDITRTHTLFIGIVTVHLLP